MEIVTISGSTNQNSTNTKFLKAISHEWPTATFLHYPEILTLPIFQLDKDVSPLPAEIQHWRATIERADAIIISTPAYLKNMPAVLKNALEWLTSSGELQAKPVIALTLTPHPPRGAEVMQSLLWTLGALEANVVVQAPFYQNEFKIGSDGTFQDDEMKSIIKTLLEQLPGN